MKTYNIYILLLVVLVIGCSKSDGTDTSVNIPQSVDAVYNILLNKNGMLTATKLDANYELITQSSNKNLFESIAKPTFTYRDGLILNYYKKNIDCSGEIVRYNFEDDSVTKNNIFKDILDCTIDVIALASSNNSFHIAYSKPNVTLSKNNFYLRTITLTANTSKIVDISLVSEPIQMVYSNNRLFILSKDVIMKGENTMAIIDANKGTLIHELNLDVNVKKIAKTPKGKILISYEDSHVIIDPNTLVSTTTVRYDESINPKLGDSKQSYFDGTKLYYPIASNLSNYPNSPAVYDFMTNTTILYLYENFFTPEQQQFEFEIGDTTMVSYDAKNNLILIGYKKSNNPNLGGLLRIKSAPEPKFIDQIDLEGVPYNLFTK